MHKFTSLLFVLCASLLMSAQEPQPADSAAVENDSVPAIQETQPEFPGGEMALRAYLKDSIRYPESIQGSNKYGSGVYSFSIRRDGSLGRVRVTKSVGDSLLDQEAIRVISGMPRWKPAMQWGDGKMIPVSVVYTLPVNFQMK